MSKHVIFATLLGNTFLIISLTNSRPLVWVPYHLGRSSVYALFFAVDILVLLGSSLFGLIRTLLKHDTSPSISLADIFWFSYTPCVCIFHAFVCRVVTLLVSTPNTTGLNH